MRLIIVESLIQISFFEQLSKRAVLSLVINDIIGLGGSNRVKSADRGRFVSFAHAALVERDGNTSHDSNNRDHDKKFDQREAFAA